MQKRQFTPLSSFGSFLPLFSSLVMFFGHGSFDVSLNFSFAQSWVMFRTSCTTCHWSFHHSSSLLLSAYLLATVLGIRQSVQPSRTFLRIIFELFNLLCSLLSRCFLLSACSTTFLNQASQLCIDFGSACPPSSSMSLFLQLILPPLQFLTHNTSLLIEL